MNELFRKLKLKPGSRAAFFHVPADYPLGELPEGVEVAAQPEPGSCDLVHLFVSSRMELEERAPQVLEAVKHAGFLWISYPKKTSKIKTDIHRDAGWDVVKNAGWEGIALISVDDTWSAMRFRPSDLIGK
jgi:hypothetical protein